MEHGKKRSGILDNESGYVLIGVLFILLLMIVIGLAGTTDTGLELQIASNDRIRRETFYQADGTTQIAVRLVEESVGSAGPFTKQDSDNILKDPDTSTPNTTVLIVDDTLWNNEAGRDFTNVDDPDPADPTKSRDFAYFPGGYDTTLADPDTDPHSNVIVDGVTTTVAGAGLQQLAGYEGKGKGTAGGGGKILYTIYSQYKGKNESESIVAVQWRHVIGLELEGRL